MNQKPRIFISSSSEGKPILDALYLELNNDYELIRWDKDFFEPSKFTLECFEEKAASHDYAIFILHPDDEIIARGMTKRKTRDNVIFEYGLFFSVLGRNKVFLLEPDPSSIKVDFPSDFYGITTIRYNYNKDNPNMVGPGLQIKQQIEKQMEMTSYNNPQYLWPLKVSIVSDDNNSVNKLHNVLKKYDAQILTTTIYNNYNDFKQAMLGNQTNCAFIDIFSLGAEQGIELISYARDRHRNIGFALYGKNKDLYQLPGVKGVWRHNLEHFWKLQKDSNTESFQITVEDIIIMFFIYSLSCGYFGEISGDIIKKIFRPNVIGQLKEWGLFHLN